MCAVCLPSCCQTLGGIFPFHECPGSVPTTETWIADETAASDFSHSGFYMASSTSLWPRHVVADEASPCSKVRKAKLRLV